MQGTRRPLRYRTGHPVAWGQPVPPWPLRGLGTVLPRLQLGGLDDSRVDDVVPNTLWSPVGGKGSGHCVDRTLGRRAPDAADRPSQARQERNVDDGSAASPGHRRAEPDGEHEDRAEVDSKKPAHSRSAGPDAEAVGRHSAVTALGNGCSRRSGKEHGTAGQFSTRRHSCGGCQAPGDFGRQTECLASRRIAQ